MGRRIREATAGSGKALTLELGGKSPNLVFADSELETVVRQGVSQCFNNTGQSCNAPTRMLVQREVYDKAVAAAGSVAAGVSQAERVNSIGCDIDRVFQRVTVQHGIFEDDDEVEERSSRRRSSRG